MASFVYLVFGGRGALSSENVSQLVIVWLSTERCRGGHSELRVPRQELAHADRKPRTGVCVPKAALQVRFLEAAYPSLFFLSYVKEAALP